MWTEEQYLHPMLRGPRICAPKVVSTNIDLVYANRGRMKFIQSLHQKHRLMEGPSKRFTDHHIVSITESHSSGFCGKTRPKLKHVTPRLYCIHS